MIGILLDRMLERLRLNICAIIYLLVSNHIYTIRRGLAKGLKRKAGLGFIPAMSRLTKEERFFDEFRSSWPNCV